MYHCITCTLLLLTTLAPPLALELYRGVSFSVAEGTVRSRSRLLSRSLAFRDCLAHGLTTFTLCMLSLFPFLLLSAASLHSCRVIMFYFFFLLFFIIFRMLRKPFFSAAEILPVTAERNLTRYDLPTPFRYLAFYSIYFFLLFSQFIYIFFFLSLALFCSIAYIFIDAFLCLFTSSLMALSGRSLPFLRAFHYFSHDDLSQTFDQ